MTNAAHRSEISTCQKSISGTGSPHPGVSCDGCNQEGAMAGMRWKCAKCYDYDLCTPCYMSGKHIAEHAFVRYDTVRTRYVLLAVLWGYQALAKVC